MIAVKELLRWHFADRKILLAVSGGVDSQVLLFLLLQFLSDEQLHLVYFDHGQRDDTKVDQDVIKGIDYSDTKQRFLRWLVSGCHAIDVTVCAEGIETASQLMLCKRLGVDEGQGWLWSKAIDINEFEAMARPMETAAISLGQILETNA